MMTSQVLLRSSADCCNLIKFLEPIRVLLGTSPYSMEKRNEAEEVTGFDCGRCTGHGWCSFCKPYSRRMLQ